ncbi:hypothetical protein Acsp04_28700 [Actinomadura sp. NBRC 104425]|nr:hypothetical protein Acsp04_28700 [Actinomadura sp. NBRC 104425]
MNGVPLDGSGPRYLVPGATTYMTGSPPSAQSDQPKVRPHVVLQPRQGPPPTSQLGLFRYSGPGPAWWFTSCHGGAGTSTVAGIVRGGMASGQYWPVPDPPAYANVVLVARGHAGGLRAAQAAARQWAGGGLPTVRVVGLVVVADAPGRRPKPLRELLHLISGAFPQVWELPWVEALRLGEPPDQIQLPSAFSELAADLQRIVTGGTHV